MELEERLTLMRMHNSCRRKLRRLHPNYCLACVCVLFFFAVVLKYASLDCDLDDAIQTGDVNIPHCRDHYYMALNLLASGRKNCSKIIEGDWDEVRQTLIDNLDIKKRKVITNYIDYLKLTKDCATFKKNKKYVLFSLSNEERHYPIAYSMVIHGDIEMFERLLRSIYTPQNIYCVHIDVKSPDTYHQAVQAIASCFDNVFVASKLESVVYASWSRVQADLNCMEDLLKSTVEWKYLINTCGTDFPLKTNAEMVTTLKSLNGKNNLESETPPAHKKRRWEYHYEVKGHIIKTDVRKEPPPSNMPIFTGNAYIVVTREFVKSVFETAIAREFLDWAKDTYSPDEFLWATLHRASWMPGSLPKNRKYDTSDMIALARLVKWGSLEGDTNQGAPYSACTGKHRRDVCVYGTGDLHWMLQQHHLFANKFDPKVDDHAIQCLEEHLRYKSLYEKIM
ncbi:PREDICTED: beta-1,3-galactosyl-O-glycosyl-glycoprotein beta-1,6-N-acetylglucosaminyltransferase 3-like [Nanorana parkeri]|uniref:beta-1,3-galactosyl-O-glycosyl-glycoprotein beta-1,6-N-acetylglucosaminyltransferase 3-like n=1 Tax=Nanorana parkeri TaxID=125878 RepID=UPI000854EE29|nr:PREDICTED: beta-1,3-galactosyl-O-glycosyl-glycoprotein beta-1,6-N-acetylglucosaminyltransferase 3-like [Nanorana parkeri]